MDSNTLTNASTTVENLAFDVRDGWGEDADEASRALEQAAFLLLRAAWAHKVRTLLSAMDFDGAFLIEDSNWERPALYYGERTLDFYTFALTKSSPNVGDYLHLTIAVPPEDRQTVIDALIENNLVGGWGGSEQDFQEAHSGYGWVAVRTDERAHPYNYNN